MAPMGSENSVTLAERGTNSGGYRFLTYADMCEPGDETLGEYLNNLLVKGSTSHHRG